MQILTTTSIVMKSMLGVGMGCIIGYIAATYSSNLEIAPYSILAKHHSEYINVEPEYNDMYYTIHSDRTYVE